MVQARLGRDRKLLWLLLGACMTAVGALVLPGLLLRSHHSFELDSPQSLKLIALAQADFRNKDRDEDGVRQFWRDDVAGLYALNPGHDPAKPAIKLIELSIAAADERPRTDLSKHAPKAAKAGYWFRAIRHADEKTLAPDRFAVVCFPDHYPSPEPFTFVVDERNTIYRADLGHGRGLEVFPTDDELRATWTELD